MRDNIRILDPILQERYKKRQKEQGQKDIDWGSTFEGWKFWSDAFNGIDMSESIKYPKLAYFYEQS